MHAESAAVATELVLRKELGHVLAALDAAGVRTLVFKGAALAFTHYAQPSDRPRVDADLLIVPDQREAAVRTLEQLGYRHPIRIPGELTRSQAVYEKIDELGIAHTIDLHWQVSKPQVFGHLFPFDELAAVSVPVPALGPSARAPGCMHALAIACVHRVAHHHGAERDRPIWLTDIHLLAGRLTPADAAAFVAFAGQKGILRVSVDALGLAQRELGTTLPADLLDRLRHEATRHPEEPSATYLQPRMRRVDVLVSDLSALPSWRARVRLLGEHVFPPARYMRETYGVSSRGMLFAMYIWRVIHGAAGWFRVARSR